MCLCFMLSPDFDLRDRNDDSQVWGRRLSNLETELQQMQDVSQLYHNPAYPTTDLRRWLQKGSIWSKVPAVTAARKPDDLEAEMECLIDGRNECSGAWSRGWPRAMHCYCCAGACRHPLAQGCQVCLSLCPTFPEILSSQPKMACQPFQAHLPLRPQVHNAQARMV